MTKTERNIKEVDLWKPINDYLINEGYKVRSEVNYCDISAIRGDELVIVELKKNLSVDLLLQGVKRQKLADSVYIAIPKPKKMIFTSKWRDICYLIRRLELGLILVSFKGEKSFIEIPILPKEFDLSKSKAMNKKKRANLIKEVNSRQYDLNVGGSTGKKLVTSYRESAIFIACCLDKYGAMSPKRLRSYGTDEKKTLSILYDNHYGWFNKVSRGVYDLSDEGRKILGEYIELVKYYNNLISQE